MGHQVAAGESDDNRVFADRIEAGQALARLLEPYKHHKDVVVLALPRGGVPVGYEVARALGVDLDVLVVRKLGVPSHRELAMGAIASGGAMYLNDDVVRMAQVSESQLQAVKAAEIKELRRRELLYRGNRPALEVRGRTVILVDDGIATGASAHAAIAALRALGPAAIVVAVPVAPADAAASFAAVADRFVCVHAPADFRAVGQFYRQFGDTSDAEVRDCLERLRPGHV
ncbi:phosphoribosyltransferase [Nevskia soli]|uniref:phosphoribosyltransferase n=1 Tax=Nevskia soli TaxID=418856 RepID=UPI0004A6C320|nr:phosphoribosyltransferase family protein [Nevskia soli]